MTCDRRKRNGNVPHQFVNSWVSEIINPAKWLRLNIWLGLLPTNERSILLPLAPQWRHGPCFPILVLASPKHIAYKIKISLSNQQKITASRHLRDILIKSNTFFTRFRIINGNKASWQYIKSFMWDLLYSSAFQEPDSTPKFLTYWDAISSGSNRYF